METGVWRVDASLALLALRRVAARMGRSSLWLVSLVSSQTSIAKRAKEPASSTALMNVAAMTSAKSAAAAGKPIASSVTAPATSLTNGDTRLPYSLILSSSFSLFNSYTTFSIVFGSLSRLAAIVCTVEFG